MSMLWQALKLWDSEACLEPHFEDRISKLDIEYEKVESEYKKQLAKGIRKFFLSQSSGVDEKYFEFLPRTNTIADFSGIVVSDNAPADDNMKPYEILFLHLLSKMGRAANEIIAMRAYEGTITLLWTDNITEYTVFWQTNELIEDFIYEELVWSSGGWIELEHYFASGEKVRTLDLSYFEPKKNSIIEHWNYKVIHRMKHAFTMISMELNESMTASIEHFLEMIDIIKAANMKKDIQDEIVDHFYRGITYLAERIPDEVRGENEPEYAIVKNSLDAYMENKIEKQQFIHEIFGLFEERLLRDKFGIDDNVGCIRGWKAIDRISKFIFLKNHCIS